MVRKKLDLLVLFFILVLSYSCTSTKVMTREIQGITTGLGYELTSAEYKGEILCNVYLNSLDGAGLIPRTTIEKAGRTVVPLLIVNYMGEKFKAQLGESSLNSPYRKFLTEALLAECNSSSSFNLYEKPEKAGTDTEFLLDIKVNRCQTSSLIKLNSTAILWVDIFSGDSDFATILNNSIKPAITELDFDVNLSRDGESIYHKSYSLKHNQIYHHSSTSDTYSANQACLDNMAEGLSLATKEIVEQIVTNLSLVIESELY